MIRTLGEQDGHFDLDQVLETFEVRPGYDLDLMLPGQTMFQSTSRILAGLEPVLRTKKPAMAIVHRDTLPRVLWANSSGSREAALGTTH